jgi:NAD+ synthase
MDNNIELLLLDKEKVSGKIEDFIRTSVTSLKKNGAIVGMSGGLDSSLVLKLCVNSLGREKVFALLMPERDSEPRHLKDAINYCKELGVRYKIKKITWPLAAIGIYGLYPPTFFLKKSFIRRYVLEREKDIADRLGKDPFLINLEGSEDPELAKGLAFYRVKHRLRSTILFFYSELLNYVYAGAANKSEWLTGFFVKYGDSIADIMPIADLYKTQLFELARFQGLPDYIINKQPSPDLIPGIIDEDMLGMSYKRLDMILAGFERGLPDNEIAGIAGAAEKDINRVREITQKSAKLREFPEVLELG